MAILGAFGEKISKHWNPLQEGRFPSGKRRSIQCSNVYPKGNVQQKGSAFTFFFRDGLPKNLAEAQECDTKKYAAFFHAMLEQGIYLPPSQFETAFLSTAHTEADVDALIDALAKASEFC